MKCDLLNGSPVGPRILIDLIEFKKQEGSKIILPDEALMSMALNGRVGKVIAMGLDCYNDVFKERVGAKRPWCKVGDIVGVRSHASLFVEDATDGIISVNDQDIIHNFTESNLCVKE